MSLEIRGRLHSFETLGAVDGPGIRVVVFVQGCALRCLYCHNPDSWKIDGGHEVSAREVALKIKDYGPFIQNGGVTISGGEPLFQPQFTAEILRLCKGYGFHTACDTAGSVELEVALPVLKQSDMLLLDIKDLQEEDCVKLCGISPKRTIAILNYCESVGKRVWIRHVLVPGYTLKTDKLNALAVFLEGYSCVEKIELLPFHKMGEYKWKKLNYDYRLADVSEPSDLEIEKSRKIFQLHGLQVH